MLTMLVVDDEIYALKGITQGIEWDDLPIGKILEAENVEQAKRHLQETKVDLVISDIEMPGANGIELLKYMKSHTPSALTIFLTGHARFEYAKEALHYGCFDYVLKPVDHDVLKEIVRRAVDEIERRREQEAFEDTLELYRRQWTNQLPILVEKFWSEALSGKASYAPERLNRELQLYDIPLDSEGRVLPVLLSIEAWELEMDARDESIMEYAVRKAATEIILGEQPGTIMKDRNELNIALLYGYAGDRSELMRRCLQYVRACNDYFHCRVSCYIGEPARIAELPDALERLSQLERSNVSQTQTVIDGSQASAGETSGAPGQLVPSFADWAIMLDGGQMEELSHAVEETMARFQTESASREALELFYFGFVHMLFQAASRKGLSIYDVVTAQEISDGQAARTPALMQAWALKLLGKAGQGIAIGREASAVIGKIQTFIQENLHKELSRDDIAGAVYRNPAYLSRLFRKETGISLSDYIIQLKIERVKRHLVETNDKISNIAEGLGYMHFSYFAKLFKKTTGLTPQEYRKRHQTMP